MDTVSGLRPIPSHAEILERARRFAPPTWEFEPICAPGSSCDICYPSRPLVDVAPIDPVAELGLAPCLDRCFLHDRTDCAACGRVAELELRAMWGDR